MIFPIIITAFIQLFKPCIIRLIIRLNMEWKRNKKESIQTTMVAVSIKYYRAIIGAKLFCIFGLYLFLFLLLFFSLCLKLEIPCTILSANPSNLTVIYVCLSLIWENYHSSFDLFLRCVKPHHHFQRIGEFFTSPERGYSVIWKYK